MHRRYLFTIFKATPHNSRLTAQAPLRRLRHGICVAKMLDNTQSIICAFGLAAAAPRSPYRHLELCGIALSFFSYFLLEESDLRLWQVDMMR